MRRMSVLLIAVGAAVAGVAPPDAFVELPGGGDYELKMQETSLKQLCRAGVIDDGHVGFRKPTLVDRVSQVPRYQWVWQTPSEMSFSRYRDCIPAPPDGLILYPRLHGVQTLNKSGFLIEADDQFNVRVGLQGNGRRLVYEYRSPFAPRQLAVPTELPGDNPDLAVWFRQELQWLSQVEVNRSALISPDVVRRLMTFDLSPGERDFPKPLSARLPNARTVWRDAAEMLNAARERWQEAPYVTEYGCIYAPDGELDELLGGRRAQWRMVPLPPQVRDRIAELRELPEGPDRQSKRWVTNRLLLDFLVPTVGCASRFVESVPDT